MGGGDAIERRLPGSFESNSGDPCAAPGRSGTAKPPALDWIPLAPEGGTSGAAGHPYAAFQRALKRRNVLMALAAARDLPQLSLVDALELTILVARKDPRRHPRLAAGWLLRYLEEDPHVTIEEAVLTASCLAAAEGRRARGGRADVAGHGTGGWSASSSCLPTTRSVRCPNEIESRARLPCSGRDH